MAIFEEQNVFETLSILIFFKWPADECIPAAIGSRNGSLPNATFYKFLTNTCIVLGYIFVLIFLREENLSLKGAKVIFLWQVYM